MASPPDRTRIGIIGTSWWVDAMYLPALTTLPSVEVTAIAGRRPEPLDQRAADWSIPRTWTDWRRMLAEEPLDGVVVAASNPVHHPASLAALAQGLDVLCEKPLAQTVGEAEELLAAARRTGAVTMVPFTYAFMPGFRWLQRLVADGYVGRIHHVGLRYHTGFALDPSYTWKLDARHNPAGALADIGSHFVHLALELAGPIDHITAQLDAVADRADRDPRGDVYPKACDTAIVGLGFASGAQGVLHASTIAHEGTSMDQRHIIEVHGASGTLVYEVDWDHLQEVRGSRVGEGPVRQLPIPDDVWGELRRADVHETYRDVFRTTDAMARGWATAIATRAPVRPDFADGVDVQRILDAAIRSSTEGRRITLD